MIPHLIHKPETILAGMTFYSDCFTVHAEQHTDDDIARLWDRFSRFMDSHPQVWRHLVDPDTGYQIQIGSFDPEIEGSHEVFVGMEIRQVSHLPARLSVKVLPASRYAVFTLKGNQVTGNWPQKIYRLWLPEAGYRVTGPFMIQVYDSRYKGFGNPATEIDVAIPIR